MFGSSQEWQLRLFVILGARCAFIFSFPFGRFRSFALFRFVHSLSSILFRLSLKSFVLKLSARPTARPSAFPPLPLARPLARTSISSSVRLFARSLTHPTVCSPDGSPSDRLSVPLLRLSFVRSSVCSSVRPSIPPSVRPFVRPSARPSVRPPVRPSVRPSIRPSVRPLLRLSDDSIIIVFSSYQSIPFTFLSFGLFFHPPVGKYSSL